MAAYSSPLDELLTSEGPVGEIARDYVANPPYPGETPEDTNRRQFAENSRAAQEAARADREAKQAETANRGVQFRKARDLAARQIPSYQDPEGQVQPVTDNTGSPLNFYDKRNKIAYDSTGQPKRLEYTDPEGPPDLVDPFEGVPVTTDTKTGHQYRIVPNMPWSYVGTDEEIAAKADLVQLNKQLAAIARIQGAKATLAQRAAKIAEKKHAAITKQLSGLGINVADETGTPLTFEQLAPQIEEAFNRRAADPAANKRTGWFNSGELAPEAQQAQAKLAAEKQAAIAKAQEFHGLTQHIRDRKAAIEEMRSQHEAQLAQHLLNQQKLMGIPGLEDSSAQAPEESAPPEQPAPAGGELVAPPASISEEKKTEPAKPESLKRSLLGEIGAGLVRGTGQMIEDFGGLARMIYPTLLPIGGTTIGEGIGKATSKVSGALREAAPSSEGVGTWEPSNPNWWAKVLSENAPQLVTQLGLAVATGGASTLGRIAMFAGTSGGQTAGNVYNEAVADRIAKGESTEEARDGAFGEAVAVGVTTAALDALPGGEYFAKNPVIGGLLKKVIRNNFIRNRAAGAASEGITETLQEIVQDLGALGFRDDQKRMADAVDRWKASGVIGAVLGGAMPHGHTDDATPPSATPPTTQPPLPQQPPPPAAPSSAAPAAPTGIPGLGVDDTGTAPVEDAADGYDAFSGVQPAPPTEPIAPAAPHPTMPPDEGSMAAAPMPVEEMPPGDMSAQPETLKPDGLSIPGLEPVTAPADTEQPAAPSPEPVTPAAAKPVEQMTPEEMSTSEWIGQQRKADKIESDRIKSLPKAEQPPGVYMRGEAEQMVANGLYDSPVEAINMNRDRLKRAAVATAKVAIKRSEPFNAEYVESYGIVPPEGWTQRGNLWHPPEAKPAAQAPAQGARGVERIVSAAIKFPDGTITSGPVHGVAWDNADKAGLTERFDVSKVKSGFVTSEGRFVSAEEANQISGTKGKDAAGLLGSSAERATPAPSPAPAAQAPAPGAKEPWQMTQREYEAKGVGLPQDHPIIKENSDATRTLREAEERLLSESGFWKKNKVSDLATRRTTIGALHEVQAHTVETALRSPKVSKEAKDAYRAAKQAQKEIGERADAITSHRNIVEAALREGKPVPAEVLADYPDLAAPPAPEPPPAAATVAPAPAAVAAKPSSKFAFKEETPFYQDQLISYIVENGGINPKSDDLPELHPPPKDRGYPSHQHVFKETGKSMDEMAGRLRHESWIPEDYTSVDLQRDIYNASKSARHIEEAMKSAKEDEKQQTAFHKDTSTKGPKEKELTALDVNVGDVIQVGSEKMKVIAVDDATASFTLEDGQKYGTRTVSDGDHIFGKLVKPPKEKETAKPESFSLEKPESPDEQRARLEAAQKARDEAKAKEDMKAKAAAPLKGSAGETTADMFGEGDTPLFNEPRNAAPGTGTRYAVPSPERSPLSPEDAETVRKGIESDAPPTPELLAVQRKATVEAARKIGADPTGALRAQSVFRDFMSGRDTRETRKEVTGLTPPLDAQLRAAMLTNQALWRAARGDSPVPVVRIRLISELRKELGQEIPTAEGTRVRKVAPDLHPLVSFSESLDGLLQAMKRQMPDFRGDIEVVTARIHPSQIASFGAFDPTPKELGHQAMKEVLIHDAEPVTSTISPRIAVQKGWDAVETEIRKYTADGQTQLAGSETSGSESGNIATDRIAGTESLHQRRKSLEEKIPTFDSSGKSNLLAATPEPGTHTVATATAALLKSLGTEKLPSNVAVIHDPNANYGGSIDLRTGKITVNAARTADPVAVIHEEGIHGVVSGLRDGSIQNPVLKAAWDKFAAMVTPKDIAAERARRPGTSEDVLHEEAAIQKVLDANKGFVAGLARMLRVAIRKLTGIDLPLSHSDALVRAAADYVRGEGKSLPGKRLIAGNVIVTAPGQASYRNAVSAHHGTPHEVDKFSMAKIGTGEGAQAYGWGLYFAENPSVAEEYRRQLSRAIEVEGKPAQRVGMAMAATGRDVAETALVGAHRDGEAPTTIANRAIEDIKATGRSDKWQNQGAQARFKEAIALIEKWRDAEDIKASSGNTYTVRLDVEPEDLLDWDKQTSEQANRITATLQSRAFTKSGADRIVRNSETLGDLIKGDAISAQEFGKLDIPSRRKVLAAVFAVAQHPKVFDSIIKAIPVDVVDMLRGKQLSPEMLLNDEAMFVNLFSGDANAPISLGRKVAMTLGSVVTSEAAKVDPSYFRRTSANAATALGALNLTTGTGAEIYHALASSLGHKEASAFLASLGIPGIRYLDQGSRLPAEARNFTNEAEAQTFAFDLRQAGRTGVQVEKQGGKWSVKSDAENKRTYNYVIFDESKIRITHKNGDPASFDEATQQGTGGQRFAAPTPRGTPDQDARYLELAKKPEKNREELQRMVDAAANDANYDATLPLVHHTFKDFTEFTPGGGKLPYSEAGWSGNAIWMETEELHKARKEGEYPPIWHTRTYEAKKNKWTKEQSHKEMRSMRLYAKMLFPLGGTDADWREHLIPQYGFGKEFPRLVKDSDIEIMRKFRRDSAYILDENAKIQEVIVFNPEQVKSAEPVVYETAKTKKASTSTNAGATAASRKVVIPLSQRFNPESRDIRYAAATVPPPMPKRDPETVRGLPQGPQAQRRSLQEATDAARQVFDGGMPVTTENGALVRQAIEDAIRNPSAIRERLDALSNKNAMAGGRLIGEFFKYAIRAQDVQLFGILREYSNHFQFFDIHEGSDIGRGLFGFRVRDGRFESIELTEEDKGDAAVTGAKVSSVDMKNLLDALKKLEINNADLLAKLKAIQDEMDKQGGTEEGKDRKTSRTKEKASPPEETAQRIIASFAKTHSDTQQWNDSKKNEVRELVRKHISEPMSPEAFTEAAQNLGVEPATAKLLFGTAELERIARLKIGIEHEIERLKEGDGRLHSLINALLAAPRFRQTDAAWRKETAINYFLDNGLTMEYAIEAQKRFDAEFMKALEKAQNEAAKRIMKSASIESLGKIQDALRLNLFENKDWLATLAKESGWRGFTPAQLSELNRLDEIAEDPNSDAYEIAHAKAQMMEIAHRAMKPQGFWAMLAEAYRASALSGLPTATVNAIGPAVGLTRDLMSEIILNPSNSKAAVRAFTDSMSGVMAQFKTAFSRDAYAFHENEFLKHQSALKIQMERGAERMRNKGLNPAQRAGGAAQLLWASQDYVRRMLSSLDQASQATAHKFRHALYAIHALKDAGFSHSDISAFQDTVRDRQSLAYESAIMEGHSADVAKLKSHIAGVEAWSGVIGENINAETAADVESAARMDAQSMVGLRHKDVKESEEGMTSRLFMNPFMASLTKTMNEGSPGARIGATMAFGFVNVPYRTLRYFAGFGPYGLVRYAVWRKMTDNGRNMERNMWKQSYGSRQQAKARLREAMLGTILMTAAAALAKGTDDDDGKDGLFITGKGPDTDDRGMRDAWLKKWTPYAIHLRIGGATLRVPLTRTGEAFLPALGMAGVMDDYRIKHKQQKGKKEPKDINKAMEIAGSYFYTYGQRGILASFQRLGEMGGSRSGSPIEGAGKTLAFAASPLIPFNSAMGTITRMLTDPMDRSKMNMAVISATPVAILAGKPALNMLGDPIMDRSLSGRFIREGAPVMIAPKDELGKAYELILKQGQAPSTLNRSQIERQIGALSEEQWYRFTQIRGQSIKRMMAAQYLPLSKLTPLDFNDRLDRMAKIAKDQAIQSLRRPVIKKTPTAASTARPMTSFYSL